MQNKAISANGNRLRYCCLGFGMKVDFSRTIQLPSGFLMLFGHLDIGQMKKCRFLGFGMRVDFSNPEIYKTTDIFGGAAKALIRKIKLKKYFVS